ncbi:hypothetical protein BGZ65_006464 [Modicella reniformis]|uniref:Uncharacterized protein n=1 Tax=Modicella reniformis TaxID=1440133 RepID=A0A9P6J570_9FUNG|nr:hypothetical protein BGZ65_006464 [Modicella reniformis]
MERRREELEKKRKKLEELRRAREERIGAAASAASALLVNPEAPARGTARREIDDLVASLVGERAVTPTGATDASSDAGSDKGVSASPAIMSPPPYSTV